MLALPFITLLLPVILIIFINYFVLLRKPPQSHTFVLPFSLCVLLIVTYAIGNIATDCVFALVDEVAEYGCEPRSIFEYSILAIGGAFVGLLTFLLERAVYSRKGPWPNNSILFVAVRSIMGAVWMDLAITNSYFLLYLEPGTNQIKILDLILIAPIFFLFMLFISILTGPFIGFIYGLVMLWITKNKTSNSDPQITSTIA